MIKKVLKKTGINRILNIAINSVFCKKSYSRIRISDDAYNQTVEELQKFSPCPSGVGGVIQNDKLILESKYDLKIIVSCYNVESYISECLNSILEQQTRYTYKVLVVDDGSTDKTSEIVDQYIHYDNVDIIHQQNKGAAGARNAGLKVIDSDYIMFVDSDDLLEENAIDNLLNVAFANHADIVEGSYIEIDDKSKFRRKISHKEGKLDPLSELRGFTCMKVFHRKLWEHVYFPEGFLYEDTVMRHIIYPSVIVGNGTCYGINNPVYKYRIHKQSISHRQKNNPKCIDTLWITLELSNIRENMKFPYALSYYDHILNMIRLSNDRTRMMPEKIRYSVFLLYANYIDVKMSDLSTAEKNKRLLEKSLRTKNYTLYKFACYFL